MAITYEIKDLFKLLWAKKKTIIIATIICGLLAVPIATVSYNSALDNYNALMPKDTELKQKTPVLGAATCYVKIQIPEESTLPANIIIRNTVVLMNQDIIAKTAWENTDKENKVKYADFKNGLTITEMSGVSLIQIRHGSIDEDSFSLFIKQLIKRTIVLVPEIIHANFELKEDSSFFEPPEELNIDEIILQAPSKPHNYIKIIGTAGLAGILFACFIILLLDFLKPRIKSKEDLINNYPCDVLNINSVSEYLHKKNITAISILTMDQKVDTYVLENQLKERNMIMEIISCGNLSDVQDTGTYLLAVQPFISYHADLFACIENLPDDSYYSIVLL